MTPTDTGKLDRAGIRARAEAADGKNIVKTLEILRYDIPALLTALAQAEESYEAAVTVGLELQARADAAEARADAAEKALRIALSGLESAGTEDNIERAAVVARQAFIEARAALAGSGKERGE